MQSSSARKGGTVLAGERLEIADRLVQTGGVCLDEAIGIYATEADALAATA